MHQHVPIIGMTARPRQEMAISAFDDFLIFPIDQEDVIKVTLGATMRREERSSPTSTWCSTLPGRPDRNAQHGGGVCAYDARAARLVRNAMLTDQTICYTRAAR